MTITKMHFVIHGDWLTEFARTRWADEDAPYHAMTVIESGFPMFGLNTIMRILTGSLKLVGSSDDGMTLEDDDKTVSKHGNDLSFSSVLKKTLNAQINRIADKRLQPIIERYCWAIEQDEKHKVGTRELRRLEKGLEAVTKESHYDIYGPLAGEIPVELRMDNDTAFLVEFMNAQSQPVKAVPGVTKNNWCGWIKDDGTFYPCKYYQHDPLAVELGFKNGDDMLADGWVKVQEKNQGMIKKPADFYWRRKPTQKQIDTLWEWCTANNREFPKDQLDGPDA